ncbi:TatD family hydrolase [Candidatus Woesearchaeota archaeon]|nr:TatD family hydrolase [Candidatus Woesearchaeota archaeon]
MMYVDVHCHLDDAKFEGKIESVIERARKAGVKAIINNGTNYASNQETLAICGKYEIVKAALGFYPLECKDMTDAQIDDDIGFIRKQKDRIIAIGEVGLDYHWDTSFVEKQKQLFSRIIELSEKIKKPLIIHTRKAEKDAFEMLQSSRIKKADFHCYGGSLKLAKKIFDAGYHFSIPPSIVRDKHFQDLAKTIPASHLMTETDAPYLGPEKNKLNEPAFAVDGAKKIAELKGSTQEDMMNELFMTYQRFFG